jgi:HlyD family secretion protein
VTVQLQSPPKQEHQPRPQRLNLRWLIGLLILGGVSIGGVGIYQAIAPSQTTQTRLLTAPVERQSLSVSISANGTVEPERSINLSPKTAGYLEQLLVNEGDRVRKGQIIAYMDKSDLQGQLIQAQGQLAQQQANLTKLINGNRSDEIVQAEAQFNQAQTKLQQAEDDFQRYQQLFNEGAISQQSLNQYRSTRDEAQAAVTQAQAALRVQQTGSRPEDIAAARAQVESARGALTTIQNQVNDTVITAPFDGVVTRKYADPGSFVTPTTASSSVEGSASSSILTLATVNQVVAYLDEAQVARVNLRQPVKLTADAYPDRTFNGMVSQIAEQATTTQNVTSFEIKISLEPAAQQLLKAGMSVEAEIQVGQISEAITAPSSAIARQQNGSTGVYVVDQNQDLVLKPIHIGTTVGDRTEVKSGLTGNEQVLISFPPGMEPAPRVPGPLGNLMGGNRNSRSSSGSNSNAGGGNAPPPAN